MDNFEILKYEIQNRHASRLIECANSEGHERILRAQGSFRELASIVDFIEMMENPPKEEESEKT
jgi:hypothetical protein